MEKHKKAYKVLLMVWLDFSAIYREHAENVPKFQTSQNVHQLPRGEIVACSGTDAFSAREISLLIR